MDQNIDLTHFTKINSKWVIHLNVKWKTTKLLEDNIGENLDDFGYGDAFLDTTPKTQCMKEIINKLNFIKTSALQKTLSRELEDKLQRKYSQKTHLIRDCYPKYTKNS